jgi:hypothetical protein
VAALALSRLAVEHSAHTTGRLLRR